HLGERASCFKNVLARMFASFHPGAGAKTDADVGTVRDFERSNVSIEVAKDAARDPAQFRHRRIIRMNADAHAQFFSERDNLLDEIGVVLPKLLLAVLSSVRE